MDTVSIRDVGQTFPSLSMQGLGTMGTRMFLAPIILAMGFNSHVVQPSGYQGVLSAIAIGCENRTMMVHFVIASA